MNSTSKPTRTRRSMTRRYGPLGSAPGRRGKWSPIAVVALPALLLLALDPRAVSAGQPSKSKTSKVDPKLEVRKSINQIDGLTVEELADGTTILRVLGHVEPTFNVYRLSDPDRLVVDIAKSERTPMVW